MTPLAHPSPPILWDELFTSGVLADAEDRSSRKGLCLLRDEGRGCADTFLQEHMRDLGRRSTFDLDALLE